MFFFFAKDNDSENCLSLENDVKGFNGMCWEINSVSVFFCMVFTGTNGKMLGTRQCGCA